MKEYTSCFIGIPLPAEHQQEFEGLLTDLYHIEPKLKTVHPATPHITVFYLDVQSQLNLPSIAQVVKAEVGIVQGVNITAGGFGYFRGDDPRVLFLDIKYPEELRKFNLALDEKLTKYFADDNKLPFHPHMTVGGLWTSEAKEAYRLSVEQLKLRLNQISWTFPITEVVIYGVDSTKNPQYQEKLISVPVK